jgi:hypothetical protein
MMMIFSTTQQHHQLEANLPKLSVNVSSSFTQFPSAALQVLPEKKNRSQLVPTHNRLLQNIQKRQNSKSYYLSPTRTVTRALLTSNAHIFFKPNQSLHLRASSGFWTIEAESVGRRGPSNLESFCNASPN